jgi:hypothetical protein
MSQRTALPAARRPLTAAPGAQTVPTPSPKGTAQVKSGANPVKSWKRTPVACDQASPRCQASGGQWRAGEVGVCAWL